MKGKIINRTDENPDGEFICTCTPLCDDCERVRSCLDAGPPLPKKTDRELIYGDK